MSLQKHKIQETKQLRPQNVFLTPKGPVEIENPIDAMGKVKWAALPILYSK